MKISAEEFSHEIADKESNEERARERMESTKDAHILQGRDENVAKADDLAREGIGRGKRRRRRSKETNVFMLDVLEKFQLAISAFREDRRAEGLHDLLDGHGCACELILCGTGGGIRGVKGEEDGETYHTRPKAPLRG